ncbi:hypothetical protein KJ937_00800 [Patescibacteria group bacterium]|nr:hypothetical protein [Patescibacteria group bacterium]MBU2509008.1 hypothetical protein [Patescibacteria group bacterium]
MDTLRALAILQPQVEKGLDKVQRWTNFQKSSGSRSQTTLAHSVSIQLAAIAVITAEQRHNPEPFDAGFVHQALALHDLGELCRAEIGFDVVHLQKTTGSDLKEVETARNLFLSLPSPLRDQCMFLFLSQFASKEKMLDGQEKDMMDQLRAEKSLECLIFNAIERVDYILYAYSEYLLHGNVRIMIHVLRNQHAKLKALAEQLPGFAKEIYKPDMIAWADKLLAEYEDVEENEIPNRKEGAMRKAQTDLPFNQTDEQRAASSE